MTFEELDTICLAKPGTEKVIQWMGSHVYKVGGKVFAIFVAEEDRVTLKCASPEQAAMLIEVGAASVAPHLPRGGSAPFKGLEADELAERVQISYDTIRTSLTKKKEAELEALE